ncbi:hypothetical protein VTO42DRAFT_4203 [Malbranchea cinnamomea]
MFEFHDANIDKEKCYTTVGRLPPVADFDAHSKKKCPFSAITATPFVHSTELILPEEFYSTVWDSIQKRISDTAQYARVIMPLSAVIDGDFFNKYIKIGNILMISEGRSGVDNVYSLKNGILRLELDKSTYERAGLVGKPIRSGGRKHEKSRYVVEINLRLPSMLHGKKGFERIVWAFKNVLNASITWLFCDLASPGSVLEEDAPIKQHYPQVLSYTPSLTTIPKVLVPPLSLQKFLEGDYKDALRDSCSEIQEWLGLVSIDSPRIRADDTIDPYLSRYEVPYREECEVKNLVKITWRGLIPPNWIIKLITATLRQCASVESNSKLWFALSSSALARDAVESRDGYTILALPQESGAEAQTKGNGNQTSEEPAPKSSSRPQQDYICWEYVGNTYWGT